MREGKGLGVVPRFLGRYELKERIGAGGMGAVYRGVERKTKRIVAVKILHPYFESDPSYLERFRREAQIASLLDSPYLVRVLDSGTDRGHHFIVSEFVGGVKLGQVLEQGRLKPLQALAVGAQVARALEEAERKGIVHRDIKPDNIIFTPDGSIKVTDFGISRQLNVTRVTMTGVFVGTMSYTAPEQARGRADVRSDIYSLGITLFQMLTGELPFSADSPTGLMREHEEKPPPLEKLRGLPEPVVKLVARCLEKDPAARFQRPGELLTAIEETREAFAGPLAETWAAEVTTNLAETRVEPILATRLAATREAALAPTRGGGPPWRRIFPVARGGMGEGRRKALIAALCGGAVLVALLLTLVVLANGGGGPGPTASPVVLDTSRSPTASPTPSPTPATPVVTQQASTPPPPVDTDGDGVPDSVDSCKDAPGPASNNGCPHVINDDRDGDGVLNNVDQCPDAAGPARTSGCPDRDADGIADNVDQCPDAAGPAATNGCPDRDGDGIVDSVDGCPDAAGPAATNGCPDRDSDGIADSVDQCPDAAGPPAHNGCPDSDGDGVIDPNDACQGTPVGSSVDANGCRFVRAGNWHITQTLYNNTCTTLNAKPGADFSISLAEAQFVDGFISENEQFAWADPVAAATSAMKLPDATFVASYTDSTYGTVLRGYAFAFQGQTSANPVVVIITYHDYNDCQITYVGSAVLS